ncbi:lytic transglycosylase domain-containing protein [Aquicoccus porphyridii]|uniref:Lytic transglycosylase domain-containing protein n=1 Tax=Aquicoccus porphyridii TaxID=1852029 RepID=A0A5A9Z6C3_9RHOB|nr:lytic transglycosylase domain-containing protein [Aquicoccus porphyridii]KAA0912515.1 lytic transglycosylase domain-containing protein [Aquicoccus porphyridii]RAI53202.1 lytic transglycosylase domain-containing protein [Rhodobacteraceae bacterium AsT-22]
MAAIAVVALGLGPAPADTPPPFPEFTFKRVKPPKQGTGKRITIQIEPEDRAAAQPAAAPPAPAPETGDATGRYGWFWDAISPEIEKSGPGRLEEALIRIANPPGGAAAVGAPRLQGLQDIARAQGADILRATVGTEVSPALVLAVIAVESSGRADAVSHAGASGLMQLMPATAARFGVGDVSLATDNIKGGVAFLDFLMKEFDRDPILVLAGYNAGENAVKTHKGVPPYAETRDYVPKVLAAFQTARGLCLTTPQLVSDGCVFNVDVRKDG